MTFSRELACSKRRTLEILVCSAFWVSPQKPPPPRREALKPQNQQQNPAAKKQNKQNNRTPQNKPKQKPPKTWCKIKFVTGF